ncbi:MAG TPA: Uma2 family endonuclease [Flavilitoribacter sp.]|nr:Uma2 family endonuclease [Flavilitoribacter sp.]HMQ88368.1 Uma2 family endonuclease [Flavilitoribacter sp.]
MGAEPEKQLLKKYRLTVEDYHRMGETGILSEDKRVELLHGEIIEMRPINSPHAGMVKKLNRLLSKLFGEQYIISVQDPIELGPDSEPEPDIAVLKMRADLYSDAHPRAEDVLLVIEVAGSSLQKDRQVKMPLYAEAGIPEAWVIDLEGKAIEVYSSPSPAGYSRIDIYRPGDALQTGMVKGIEVGTVL